MTTTKIEATTADSVTETLCTTVLIAHRLVEGALGWNESAKILGEGGLYRIYGDDAKKAFLTDFRALEMRLLKISDLGIGHQEANRWRGLLGVRPPRDAASWHELGFNRASLVWTILALLAEPPATTDGRVWDLILADIQKHLPRFNDGRLVARIRIEEAVADRMEAKALAADSGPKGDWVLWSEAWKQACSTMPPFLKSEFTGDPGQNKLRKQLRIDHPDWFDQKSKQRPHVRIAPFLNYFSEMAERLESKLAENPNVHKHFAQAMKAEKEQIRARK
ncbi:MAG: hypothetical protein WCJ35_06510 [Planctomycetota bacterium]